MSIRLGLVFGLVVAAVLPATISHAAEGATQPPWSQPLRFRELPGWSTGRSGTVRHFRNESGKVFRLSYPESSAWISNVPFRDVATTDPPARTVHQMPRRGIVVWAVVTPRLPADSAKPLDLHLARFQHGLCCDGTPPPPTRERDTAGRSASGRYDVLVRVFFGSLPSPAMLRAASRALHTLVLPPVMLTLHPGQTLHLARLHIGDAIVCRTATHTIRWKATVANVNSTGSVVWDKQLQVNVTRRDSRILASCQRR